MHLQVLQKMTVRRNNGNGKYTTCLANVRNGAITRCTQSVLTANEMDSLAKAETEVKELKQMSQIGRENAAVHAEKRELQEKSRALNEDFFKGEDEKVRYYTGLTNWTTGTY